MAEFSSKDLKQAVKRLMRKPLLTARDLLPLFVEVIDALDDIEATQEARHAMSNIFGASPKVKKVTPEEFDRLFHEAPDDEEKPKPRRHPGQYL